MHVKVLVTGSAGFVGARFRQALEAADHDVYCVDIADGFDCRIFFRTATAYFDLVIHCAAVVGGRTMIEGRPFELAAEDLSIDAELWRWAQRARPGRIVYFSSAAAYPVDLQAIEREPTQLVEEDIDLDHVRTPDQSYGWVKLTGEMMARCARAEGLAVTVVRPFSGYGETQDDDYPFPAIMARVRRGENPVKVWSDTVRDFIHVDDIVAATLIAADRGIDGPVNLCTGRATSFTELATMAGAREIEILDNMPTGVYRRVGDPTRMLDFYEPRVTLEEGIARALA